MLILTSPFLGKDGTFRGRISSCGLGARGVLTGLLFELNDSIGSVLVAEHGLDLVILAHDAQVCVHLKPVVDPALLDRAPHMAARAARLLAALDNEPGTLLALYARNQG